MAHIDDNANSDVFQAITVAYRLLCVLHLVDCMNLCFHWLFTFHLLTLLIAYTFDILMQHWWITVRLTPYLNINQRYKWHKTKCVNVKLTMGSIHQSRMPCTKRRKVWCSHPDNKSTLCIAVSSAKLTSGGGFFKPDPYLELSVDGQPPRKTEVIKKSASPGWNEHFTV